mgnify:FL=1
MGRPRKDLSAAEEQASRLISAQKIYESLQHGRAFGIHGVPQKHRAGAPDPHDRTGNAKLPADYRYYRIAAPDTNEGRRQTEFIKSMGYVEATDGEYFPSMPGGKIYKCHPAQHDEANKAMKMIAVREHSKAAESERHRLQESARYKFGMGEVTAEIDSREIDPRNL